MKTRRKFSAFTFIIILDYNSLKFHRRSCGSGSTTGACRATSFSFRIQCVLVALHEKPKRIKREINSRSMGSGWLRSLFITRASCMWKAYQRCDRSFPSRRGAKLLSSRAARDAFERAFNRAPNVSNAWRRIIIFKSEPVDKRHWLWARSTTQVMSACKASRLDP